MIEIKSSAEIARMRNGGALLAQCMQSISKLLEAGISTLELDGEARRIIDNCGGKPSFLNYNGFPNSICVSVNSEVVHGIPSKNKLALGDLVSIDIGICLDGFHTDMARSFVIGEASEEQKYLIETTETSFWKGVEAAKPGNRIGDISQAIQSFAEGRGCGVVRALTGHGVGRKLHEDPEVPNFGFAGRGPRLKAGMTLAIEPMINLGGYEVYQDNNGWTIITRDGKLSAHYENTIAITEDGYEILTALPEGS